MSNIKVILLGLNYSKNKNLKLEGCINDIYDFRDIFIDKFKIKSHNIEMYHDYSKIKPTRLNIIKILNRVVKEVNNSKLIDTLWIHYSGHGFCTLDYDGDENGLNDKINGDGEDGFDEMITTLDAEYIKDDQFNDIFSKLLPKKKLIAIFDCCHSGTILVLPYKYDYIYDRLVKDNTKYNKIVCDAILLSGCKDTQKSESQNGILKNNKYNGAFSSALIKCLKKNIYLSIDSILEEISKYLKYNRFLQEPQISSTISINKNTKLFYIDPCQEILNLKLSEYNNIISFCKKYLNNNIRYKKYLDYYTKKRNILITLIN